MCNTFGAVGVFGRIMVHFILLSVERMSKHCAVCLSGTRALSAPEMSLGEQDFNRLWLGTKEGLVEGLGWGLRRCGGWGGGSR